MASSELVKEKYSNELLRFRERLFLNKILFLEEIWRPYLLKGEIKLLGHNYWAKYASSFFSDISLALIARIVLA